MVAECYARINGRPGVLSVTTGPGAINTLNGVFGAYTDSVPLLVISGQVKREVCAPLAGLPGLRQLGYQQANVTEMVRGITKTKYSVLLDDPDSNPRSPREGVAFGFVGTAGPLLARYPARCAGGDGG